MKKLAMILGLASLFASGTTMATEGRVKGTGTVAANTCTIKAADAKTVAFELDPVYSNSLKAEGKTAGAKDFSIVLENCPIKSEDGSRNVKLVFVKDSHVDDATGNLKDTGNAPNIAKNVQFQVLHNGAVVNFNQAELQKALASKNDVDEVSFDFTAQYYATGVAEAGSLSSSIPFRIEYE